MDASVSVNATERERASAKIIRSFLSQTLNYISTQLVFRLSIACFDILFPNFPIILMQTESNEKQIVTNFQEWI